MTRILNSAAIAILGVGILTGCSSGKARSAPAPTTTASSVPGIAPLVSVTPPTPKSTPIEAVTAVLAAEQANDHGASFGLVDPAGREVYKTAPDWERRRAELAPITRFKIESTKGADVTALVEHRPGIDPFIGLHFAQEHQTWHAVKVGTGWLVDPDPTVTPVVPSDAGARTAALSWAGAMQACDNAGATALQALPNLLGVSAGPGALCHVTGTPSADAPSPADQGPQTADLVAQYTVDVLPYVRMVRITDGSIAFDTYLVPVGDAWRIVGVAG